jgi:hypothetical protein
LQQFYPLYPSQHQSRAKETGAKTLDCLHNHRPCWPGGGGQQRVGINDGVMDRTLWQPWRWRRSEAEGGDGRWGRNEVTARRAAPPVDGWRRGRAARSVAVGAVVLLFFVLMVIFDQR